MKRTFLTSIVYIAYLTTTTVFAGETYITVQNMINNPRQDNSIHNVVVTCESNKILRKVIIDTISPGGSAGQSIQMDTSKDPLHPAKDECPKQVVKLTYDDSDERTYTNCDNITLGRPGKVTYAITSNACTKK